MKDHVFSEMIEKIIKEQEAIIGPIALEQAEKVPGLKVNWQKHEVSIDGDGTDTVEKLVEQYRAIFGQASVEACKEAVSGVISQIPRDQIPNLLR